MRKFKIKKITETAQLPTRSNKTDAGYDLYADEDKLLLSGMVTTVSTGIAVQIPDPSEEEDNIRCYGRIAPRSGLAVKHGIDTFAGVVDEGYTGEVLVALYNAGAENYEVKKGDRIAQLILTPIITPELEEVNDLDNSDRGSDGFGSSGK